VEASLDGKSIPEQVAWLEDLIENARTNLFIAHQLAERILAARNAGVLSKAEGQRFAPLVVETVKDIQAMLVLHWSGRNSDREVLEQLHLIYYPRKRPDGGLALSLIDHMFLVRDGFPFAEITEGVREGPELSYWKRLVEYIESHPDEPAGWRKRVSKGGGRSGAAKKVAGKRRTSQKPPPTKAAKKRNRKTN
jgi:hypothetical protein